jgi:hypothetical protein
MAFEHALRAGRPGVPESQARVQSAVIQAMTATGLERGELWRVTADPTTLATGACYAEGGRSLRAFYPDTAPGYFGDGWPGPPPRAESACGWQTPLVLHLGTFPVGLQLAPRGVGPGARWASSASQPALEGLHVVASLLEPATNLRQDARQVAAIYRHFATHTAPLVAPSRASSRAGPRPAACTGAVASCSRTRAASTSRPSTAHAAASPRPPTTTSCAASPASSPSAARRSGPWRPSPSRSSDAPRPRPIPACASRPRRWPVRAEPVLDSTRGPALPILRACAAPRS